MQRDARTFLWDIRDAADAIQGYVQGRSFDDYLANRLLRSGVEREFVTVGEAMSQLAKTAPPSPRAFRTCGASLASAT